MGIPLEDKWGPGDTGSFLKKNDCNHFLKNSPQFS